MPTVPRSTSLRRLAVLGAVLWILPAACAADRDEPQAASSQESGAGAHGGAGGGANATDPVLLVQIGADVPPGVADRMLGHLEERSPLPVELLAAEVIPDARGPGSVVLAVGDAAATQLLVPDADANALEPEGYLLRSGEVAGMRALVAAGADGEAGGHGDGAIGSGYGAYALLEHLGFAFLHPLEATEPAQLELAFADVDRSTQPRWPIRGLQLHTMHPLELTELLQGWGVGGPEDAAGFEAMLPEWDSFLEWSIANGQNRVHWVLLWAEPWGTFGDSQERIDRLTTLVDRAHAFAIGVGIDAPLRQQQQHTFRLIREDGTVEEELAQIRDRLDHLMSAGFDYFTTESGSTEFTSTDDTRTVAWMDEVASHLADVHDKPAYIKIHTSSGQTVANYTDPDTGEPLNYNFLPHYADPRLGIMPHSVQHYALDDQAPTYGNVDFGFMREFLQREVGRRPVVWHPETAYWVSFDADVPLLLPVYAHRRVRDLRLLASDEDAGLMGRGEHAGKRMDGQLTFSSGWEWGYWLQEVVTARSAWGDAAVLGAPDDDAALAEALGPVVRPFGAVAEPLRELLVRLSRAQLELLIEGRVGGVAPSEVVRRNGQAYLQGFETWDDLSEIAESVPGLHVTMTQPQRLGLLEMRNPFHAPPGYSAEIEPLLAEMEQTFTALADEIEALRPDVPAHALPLFDDIAHGSRVLALRATQIHGLYDYVDAIYEGPASFGAQRLQTAMDALDQALAVVTAHESNYRVPPDRIAAWRHNPTAYAFTYLWTVRSLFYWWRDEAKAVLAPLSPCYLNVINPVSLAMGEGALSSATDTLATVFEDVPGLGTATECTGAPASAPTLPPDGLRD
jgi:hypothetical protein